MRVSASWLRIQPITWRAAATPASTAGSIVSASRKPSWKRMTTRSQTSPSSTVRFWKR